MKRLVLMVATLFVLLALCACSSEQPGSTPTTTPKPPESTAPVESPVVEPLEEDPAESPVVEPVETPEPEIEVTPSGNRFTTELTFYPGLFCEVEEGGAKVSAYYNADGQKVLVGGYTTHTGYFGDECDVFGPDGERLYSTRADLVQADFEEMLIKACMQLNPDWLPSTGFAGPYTTDNRVVGGPFATHHHVVRYTTPGNNICFIDKNSGQVIVENLGGNAEHKYTFKLDLWTWENEYWNLMAVVSRPGEDDRLVRLKEHYGAWRFDCYDPDSEQGGLQFTTEYDTKVVYEPDGLENTIRLSFNHLSIDAATGVFEEYPKLTVTLGNYLFRQERDRYYIVRPITVIDENTGQTVATFEFRGLMNSEFIPELQELVLTSGSTLADSQPEKGTYLYIKADGTLSLTSNGHTGPVDNGLGPMNIYRPSGGWQLEQFYPSLLYAGQNAYGYWEVNLSCEPEKQAHYMAFYWDPDEQTWRSSYDFDPDYAPEQLRFTVTPTAQNEAGDLHTHFDLTFLDTTVSYEGTALNNEMRDIQTCSADLDGDGVQELIAIHTAGYGIGTLNTEIHVFNALTLEKIGTAGLVESLRKSLTFTRSGETYYIAADKFSAAISFRNIPYEPEYLLDNIYIGEYNDFKLEDGKFYAVFPCCVAEGLSYYGEIWVELKLGEEGLVAADYELRDVGRYTQRSLQAAQAVLNRYQDGTVFARGGELDEPLRLLVAAPGQFRIDTLPDEFGVYDPEGNCVGVRGGFMLVKVPEDFVMDETVAQTMQMFTSGGIYAENIVEGKNIVHYTTVSGYEAIVYEDHYTDGATIPEFMYAYIRIAPDYVLNVAIQASESLQIGYELLDSIVIVDGGSVLTEKDITITAAVAEWVLRREAIPEDYLHLLSGEQRSMAEEYNGLTVRTKQISLDVALELINYLRYGKISYSFYSNLNDDDCRMIGSLSEILLYEDYEKILREDEELTPVMALKADGYNVLASRMKERFDDLYEFEGLYYYFELTEELLRSLILDVCVIEDENIEEVAKLLLDRQPIPEETLSGLDENLAEMLRQYNEQTAALRNGYSERVSNILDALFDSPDYGRYGNKAQFCEQFHQNLVSMVLYRKYSNLSLTDPVTGLLACVEGGGSYGLWAWTLTEKMGPWDEEDELKLLVWRYYDLVDEIWTALESAASTPSD